VTGQVSAMSNPRKAAMALRRPLDWHEETLTVVQQTCQAWSAGYRCYAQLAVHSSEVAAHLVRGGKAMELGMDEVSVS
jgi:hypothetical protein